jgi:hypothetical protein
MQLEVLSNLLTHSRMSKYKTCPRAHWYAYELGIRPDRPSTPLRLGAAVHVGLDEMAKGEEFDAACETALQGYQDYPAWAVDDAAKAEWDTEGLVVVELLRGYGFRWQADGFEYVESEASFRVPIINPETGKKTPAFEFGGKRDKIAKLADGRLALVEHKTVGEDIGPESQYWLRLRIDQQISGYYIAALDAGIEIQTVIYDCIRKPEISPRQIPLLDDDGVKIVLDAAGQRVRTKDGKKWRESGDAAAGYVLQTRTESPEEFAERLRLDIAARPDWYYQRQEIPRLASDLREFREELWQIQQQIREAQKSSRWFRNTSACRMWGGICEYFGLCTTGADVTGDVPQGFVKVEDVHPEL